jgi:AraC-like DNA-binding protein
MLIDRLVPPSVETTGSFEPGVFSSSWHGVSDRRDYSPSAEGLFFEERELETEATFHGIDAVGPLWVVGVVEILAGSFAVVHDGIETWFDRGLVGMFKAPFCLPETKSNGIHCRQHVAFFEGGASPRTAESVAFEVDRLDLPRTKAELMAMREGRRVICRLDRCSRPSAIARRAKDLLDASFADELPIGAVATRLNTSNASLTAAFKKAFGLSPLQYRTRVRTTLSVAKLLRPGAKIVDVAQDVGYQDLSRFNKQFKSATGLRPKDVRTRRIRR